jgi:PAS domain S-box-containing protein
LATLSGVHACLAGFFACAAIHYAIQWWFSRNERVFLVFSVQCALYTAFCVAIVGFFSARTISDIQAALDRFVTLGVLVHAVVLKFYAYLGNRRDRAFHALVTGLLIVLAVLNQWTPLRGTVLELKALQLPGGATSLLPIRTPPGAPLAVLYFAVLAVQMYGFFVAHLIWKRDRSGAILIAFGSAAVLVGAGIGFLVDFAKVQAPYTGAAPHAIFVLCVSLFLSREYSARGTRVLASERKFETAFEHAPIGKALLELDGRFLRVNLELCRILGWTAEELCARRLGDVTHQDDAASDAAESRLFAGEIPAHLVEKRLLRKTGEPVWALLAVSVVPDDNARPVRLIAHVQDMTELRTHRERLLELVRQARRMAQGVP